MIPVMGAIVEKSTVARTTRTLGTLVQSGVPILESLNIVRDTAGNMVFERAFTRIYESIREGETIAQPLREARIVDDIVVNMIDVGEETGDLDTMLNKIADNYDEEVETLVESLVSLLEPIMIVVLGGIIGFIVIALFLPLISLDQQAVGLRQARPSPSASPSWRARYPTRRIDPGRGVRSPAGPRARRTIHQAATALLLGPPANRDDRELAPFIPCGDSTDGPPPEPEPARLHADRSAGRHPDHRDPDRHPAAGRLRGATARPRRRRSPPR